MSTPSPDQIKTLEQSRQRLIHLTRSLASLITSLNQSDPLPQWSSLQSQATIISNNLLNVSEHLSANSHLLSTLVAYPSPSYPTRTQANVLEQILRTKLDPRVEDWVARGRKAGTSALEDQTGLAEMDLAELWHWAPVEANQEARGRNWGGNFTREEREGEGGVAGVVTGLRRVLEDDDEGSEEEDGSEEEEEEDEMEVVGVRRKSGGASGLEFDIAAVGRQEAVAPVVPLEEILRYMTTGMPPAHR